MKNIKFFDYQSLFKAHKENLLSIFEDVASRGAFILQNDLEEFENEISKYVNAESAIGVGNATDALQLLFLADELGPGDEVIFCSHTMIATASAIKFCGAKPVPIEAGADHLIDTSKIENSINSRTKAIIPTQLNGRIADMNIILEIAKKYNLRVYEDSAQALGATYNNTFAGTFDRGGCISFYPAKTLGCFGDGGMVICNDKSLSDKIKLLRDHGRDSSGNVSVWGYNSRLDNLQAAILNYYFKSYHKVIEKRRHIANLYDNGLKSVKNIILPPAPLSDPIRRDVYQNYEIEAENRDELKLFLQNNNVGTLLQWGGKAVHEFEDLGFNIKLPETERIMRRSLLLPLNLSILDEDVEFICNLIKNFYEKK
tara:strand:+ start:3188 stop:4297 length:1110 start_codon:yes stop_codon:yes gene_type:complete